MNKNEIKELALKNGFKLKEQPDGTVDLNPYVYAFALELMAEAGVKGLRHGVALASDGSISTDSILMKIWSDGYAAKVREGGEQ